MKIRDHWLLDADRRETPNKGGEIEPRYVVMHYTAGRNAEESIAWLCSPAAKASAHAVVARDGRVAQLAPFNIKTWHAGVSEWNGVVGLNDYSIGIELDNGGRLFKVGSSYRDWRQCEWPADQVVEARHKMESHNSYWCSYTEEQVGSALDLVAAILEAYGGLKGIVGHDDIAPLRKWDPGPAFPMESFRARLLGRRADLDPKYRVVAGWLNIRSGPGVENPVVAPPLPRGTQVVVIQPGSTWSKVSVCGRHDLEGWVSNQFIASGNA
jgi:N-acetylmuramoyl-L-alanine amidase